MARGQSITIVQRVAIGGLSLCALSACSLFSSSETPISEASSSASYLADGMVAIAGPIPAIQPSSVIAESARALGFVPTEAMHDGTWVSIESRTGKVRLMNGSNEVRSGMAEGTQSLKPGTFELKHKQRNALWHAPDAYFTARGLNAPATGSKSRFLRGALGEFSLFIDKSTPIHSGPLWTKELGGLKLDENLLSQMYYSLEVGAPIEVL